MKLSLFFYTLLCIVTFGGVLPYFCGSLVYSAYFVEGNVIAEAVVRESNERRMRLAEDHLNKIKDHGGHLRLWSQRLISGHLDILIVVKTVDRTRTDRNPYTGYLTQTVAALDREIVEFESIADGGLNVGLLLCNADPIPSRYDEARTLSRFYPTVERWTNVESPGPTQLNRRNTEKEDYAYCLRAALDHKAKYVLIVEDDAEPYVGFLCSLSYVLNFRVVTRVVAGEPVVNGLKWAYLRLYFPERWAGYAWEILHVSELIGVGSIGGTVTLILYWLVVASAIRSRSNCGYCWLYFGLGAAYVVLVVLAVGRQHLMQIRRIVPAFLMVGPAYRCCTPAVIYPADVADEIVRYLATVTCSNSFGVDLALDRFAEQNERPALLVQPNLVHHRGAYSTLTKPKIFTEFLFDS